VALDERTKTSLQKPFFNGLLPLLRSKQPAKIVFACDEVLGDLFACAPCYDVYTTRVVPPAEVDRHIPLMSLAGLFETTTKTVPADIPYLKADPALVQGWKNRLGQRAASRRIGIAWAGRPTHPNDYSRSCPLTAFSPLFDAFPNFDFVSLQVGSASRQVREMVGRRLADYSPEIRNFTDTAALIENLDLVVTVDTAVAHLAGAIGKPVWVLLNFDPDWRWLLKGQTTAWYPTMRLFRQPRPGDWRAVMDEVRGGLLQVSRP